MKTIKVETIRDVPDHFTGVASFLAGGTFWFKDGKRHREDGPAYESPYREEWWLHDNPHREDGPALTIATPGNAKETYWYLHGKQHREDGPAIELPNGTKEWYLNGVRHREDGPAIELPNGTKEWYLNGTQKTQEVVELHYMLKYKKVLDTP